MSSSAACRHDPAFIIGLGAATVLGGGSGGSAQAR
jgi:hypothetical protein